MNEREVLQLMKQTFLRIAPRDQAAGVRRFFAEATIGAGLLGLDGDPGTALARGLAVGVANDDPVLGPVFGLRDRLGDRELEQAWQIQAVRWGFLSHPREAKALLRFQVVADLRPPTASRKVWVQRISRAILLDPFFLDASLLRRFDEPGCLIWLIPESVAGREAARRGPGSMYDVLPSCLRAGTYATQRRHAGRPLLQLGFPPEFFERGRPAVRIDQGQTHFRRLRSTSKLERDRLVVRLELLTELLGRIEEQVRLPALNIPCLEVDPHEGDQAAEAAAQEVRRVWGLGSGPIDHVVRLLEAKGVILVRPRPGTGDVDAFSTWAAGRP
jgi:hypothetical protein